MKIKGLFSSLLLAGFVFISTFGVFSADAKADGMKMLDAAYAADLCQSWNKSSLPKRVGRSGSGWIDSADSKGQQVLVINRKDCKGWKKVQLVIKADAKGQAMCVSGGAFDGKQKLTWKFEPSSLHWADFSDGFGTFDMPKIMKGFVGPYGTAMNNLGNFEIFFAVAGKLALDKKVDWACTGADAKDVADEIKDIDLDDMRKLAKK